MIPKEAPYFDCFEEQLVVFDADEFGVEGDHPGGDEVRGVVFEF